MQSMAGTNNSTALLNDNTDDNPTLDNNLTKMSQSDREREREELIMAERNYSSQPYNEEEGESTQMKQPQKEEEDSDEDFDSEEDEDQTYQNDNVINFQEYKYSVTQGTGDLKSQYEAKDLTIRKLQYVTGEILNDLGIKKLDAWSGSLTLIIAFVVLWLRMAIHYLGQYILLKIMNAPVI